MLASERIQKVRRRRLREFVYSSQNGHLLLCPCASRSLTMLGIDNLLYTHDATAPRRSAHDRTTQKNADSCFPILCICSTSLSTSHPSLSLSLSLSTHTRAHTRTHKHTHTHTQNTLTQSFSLSCS
jgi:hypothetical protein